MTKKSYRVLKEDRFQGKRPGDTVELDLHPVAEQRYIDSGLLEQATNDEPTTDDHTTTEEG